MSAEVLGRAVDNEISAECKGALQDRAQKSVVDSIKDVVLPTELAERLQVGDPEQRVARCFEQERLGACRDR